MRATVSLKILSHPHLHKNGWLTAAKIADQDGRGRWMSAGYEEIQHNRRTEQSVVRQPRVIDPVFIGQYATHTPAACRKAA
jgi:hypothetical protein